MQGAIASLRLLATPGPAWRNAFRPDRLCVFVLIFLAMISWLPRLGGPLDLRWDASVYYVLGTGLANGEGYRLLNEPGHIQAVQYPPLLPALIALHQIVLRNSDPFAVTAALKYTWIGFFVMLVVGSYLLVRRFASWEWALFAGISTVLNFNLQLHFNQCSAELPYAAATLFFLAIYRVRPSLSREALMAIAGVAAFFIRTMGISLLGAWVLDGLLRKQFGRATLRLLVSLGCIVLWQGYIGTVETSPSYRTPNYSYQRADYMFYNVSYSRNVSYVDPYRPELGRASLMDVVRRVSSAARDTPRRIGETITSYQGIWEWQNEDFRRRFGTTFLTKTIISAGFIVLGCLALVGLSVLFVRRERLIPIYCGSTILALCAAPWPLQHVRYLVPVVPVLLLGIVLSLNAIWQSGRSTAFRAIMRLLVFSVAGAVLLHQILAYYEAQRYMLVRSEVRNSAGQQLICRQLCYEPELIAMDRGIAWLGEHVPKGSVVAGAMPQWIYLQTGLQAVMPPLEIDPKTASKLLDSVPVSYLMVEGAGFYSSPYGNRVVTADPKGWRLVYGSDENSVRIYERLALLKEIRPGQQRRLL